MCGIYGLLKAPCPVGVESLSAMSVVLAHRGPDDRGVFADAQSGIAIGQNRLSIIDLSPAGHQPMFNEDGTIAIVFNGEIYNFQGLRAELVAKGHQFASRTDSEVLIHGYEEWGTGLLDRIAGMFAFAIWDFRTRSLWLARDQMGMKPLYYWISPTNDFWFASEIKAFRSIPEFSPKLNRRAIRQYLEFNFVYDTEECSLEGIRKLPAGHSMLVKRSERPRIARYFTPPPVEPCSDDPQSIDCRADRLYGVFQEVVSQHLISDVPVGLLLSGGLDSSLVASVASQHQKLHTLSFAFADSKIDERPYARIVSRHIGSDHEELVIEASEVTEDLENSAWFFDDLFGDWGLISTRLLYQKCRDRGLKVVLVGEGSDELFGGYRSFQLIQNRNRWNPLSLELYRWFSGRRWGKEWLPFHRLLSNLKKEAGGDSFAAVRMFETRHQLPNNYNMKVDKASMAASVEARVPFLDVRIAREGYACPSNLLLRDGTNKYLLRRMAERHKLLPQEIIQRAKFGASIAASWMDDSPQFREYAREKILGAGSVTAEFGLEAPMKQYFDYGRRGAPVPSGLSIYSIIAWRLLLLNVWAKRYVHSQT